MTEPPTTVAEFEALLAKAKEAGLLPIMEWNASAERWRTGVPAPATDGRVRRRPSRSTSGSSRRRVPRSTRRPTCRRHSTSSSGSRAGYFPEDVNAIEYTDANARFAQGEGVFIFNGDWQNGVYDKDQPGNVGFFVFPPAEAGGAHGSMGVPAHVRHREECQARRLRGILLQLGRHERQGTRHQRDRGAARTPAVPRTWRSRRSQPDRSPTRRSLRAPRSPRQTGLMDFIANATGAIFPQGWTPELQKMVGGKQTPRACSRPCRPSMRRSSPSDVPRHGRHEG